MIKLNLYATASSVPKFDSLKENNDEKIYKTKILFADFCHNLILSIFYIQQQTYFNMFNFRQN